MQDQTRNDDETSAWFDMLSLSTVTEKGTTQVKLITMGNEHSYSTVIPACTEDSRKLLLFTKGELFTWCDHPGPQEMMYVPGTDAAVADVATESAAWCSF